MFPHTLSLSGIPSGAGLDMTAEFAPLLMGLIVVLGVCIPGMALETWVYYARAQQKAKVEVLYRKHFFCPVKWREVKVDFRVWKGEPGNLLGIERCSAFQEGEEIDCDKSCLHLPQAQAALVLLYCPLSPSA